MERHAVPFPFNDCDTFSLREYTGTRDTPVQERHDLVDWLTQTAKQPQVAPAGSAIVTMWRPDGAPPGSRLGHSAQTTSALVLDYDTPRAVRVARIDLAVLSAFFARRCFFVMFTTQSHRADYPHCRVVLPLARRITVAQRDELVRQMLRETRQAGLPDFDREASLEWMRAPRQYDGVLYESVVLGTGRLDPATVLPVVATPGRQTLAILRPHVLADVATHSDAWRAIGDAGFVKRAYKRVQWTPAQVKVFYAEHVGRDYYPAFEAAMCEGPAEALILEADDAVRRWREFLGATDPLRAAPGTFRARFGRALPHNAAHGSDSDAAAAREIAFCFAPLDRLESAR